MSASRPGPRLFGRSSECAAVDALLAGVLGGRSAVLVLRGEPGTGKTTLLEYLAMQATGCRVARAGGVESERELAFAGLHQLLAPLLDGVERLPGPQRQALRVAFGMQEGASPDRFTVGVALLSLLSNAADERPLVCVVDDVQWLDRDSVTCLAFVARRLVAERIALVFGRRDSGVDTELVGLPELPVTGLGDRDARLLFASTVRGRVDHHIRDRIVAESRGNPLALLELYRGLSPADVGGGFVLPDVRHVQSRLEQEFVRRLQSLPAETQRLLLVAAAEPVGDVTLVWRAAERLRIAPAAAAAAESDGLVDFGLRVRFRHPLVRSASYRAAAVADRQRVHRALAEAIDPELDPDRRAWHRAYAAAGPDEDVAGELEHSAARAQGRGGAAAAAAFLERAAELTPGPAHRGKRLLAAAQAKFEAAAPDAAAELVAAAEVCPLDELQSARLERLRARIEFGRSRGGAAPLMLLGAAKRLEPLDRELARETYLEALGAAVFAGRLTSGGGVVEIAQGARAAPPMDHAARGIDLLLDGLAIRFTDGPVAATAILQRALQAFSGQDGTSDEAGDWLWLACRIAPDVWDDELWHALTTRQVRVARDAGALTVLPMALTFRAGVHVLAGEFGAAMALIEEADAITVATGNAPFMYGSLVVTAWRGRGAQALDLVAAGLDRATSRGEGRAITLAEYARAVLANGVGDYKGALKAAQRACEQDDLDLSGWALSELVEAGARSGQPSLAEAAVHRLDERTRASGSDWGLATAARAQALVSSGREAETLYREAAERLARTRITVDLARAHLLFGEWLRRENRRLEAREQLRQAHGMFTHMGAEAFAERTRRELLATGETVRKRMPHAAAELTAQESQIAWMARDGHTNQEIAVELFLSSRTVEYHLRKVFTKLRISSRRELRTVLNEPGTVGASA
jgi:DNA-binding CsgD family transcriptional regulator/tetratricopeptide (TPR) repeat protein